MENGMENGISVIISTYDDPIDFVSQCIKSLLPQKIIQEIIVVDSSIKDEIKKFCFSLKNNKINYIYTPPKGLSAARNKGIKIANRHIVAFTDSDCIVDKDWAENIYNSFSKNVAIIGGKILPKWQTRPNKILSKSIISQGYYSLINLGEEIKEVDQIYGGNFAVDLNLLSDEIFLSKLGRRKENLLSGEETELCRQIKKENLKIIYNPLVIVWHQIPEERIKFKWMCKRVYYGGISRAMVGGMPTPKSARNTGYSICDILFLIIFSIPYILGISKFYLKY